MRTGAVTILAVGKIRTSYWQLAQAEYARRTRHYISLDIQEVKDYHGTGLLELDARAKEGRSLLNAAKNLPGKIATTPQGKSFSSEAWAAYLQKGFERFTHLAIFIGGPSGLSPEVLAESPMHAALSEMTFPHEMARVVLLEQLYRAMTILAGEKYHK